MNIYVGYVDEAHALNFYLDKGSLLWQAFQIHVADMYSFPVFIACAVQKILHAITFQ